MDSLTVDQGRTLIQPVQLRDSDARALAGVYDGTEPLALEVWPGDRRMALALSSSGVAWGGTDRDGTVYGAADGVITVAVDDADTATLEPGSYRLAVALTDGGEPVTCYEAVLRVRARPGLEAEAPTYIDADDLTDEFPSLFDLEDLDTEQAAAAEPRAEARAWFDDQVVARAEAKVEEMDWLGLYADADRAALASVRDLLDADKLLVDEGCRRINACYALYRALKGQVGREGKNPYAEQAAAFLGEARRRLAGYRARLDADDDGAYELTIG